MRPTSRDSSFGRAEEHVELQLAGAQLGERLVERVERRDLDLDALLLAELLQHGRVEVVGVVVDPQLAALLGLDGALDRLEQARQRHRVVAAGERDAGGVDRPARGRIAEDALPAAAGARDAHRRGRVLAAGQAGRGARGQRRPPARASSDRRDSPPSPSLKTRSRCARSLLRRLIGVK